MNHLVFLPWTPAELPGELLTRFRFNDRKVHLPLLSFITKYRFHLYAWQQDDPTLRAVFRNLSSSAVVYVRGHGAAGDACISPTPTGAGLKFDAVCDRLINAGLKTTFGGKIKFYTCESADGGDNAFARRAASYLRDQRYRNCRIFGYSGDLSTRSDSTEPDPPQAYQRNPDFQPIQHKYPHKWSTTSEGIVQRAKAARHEYP